MGYMLDQRAELPPACFAWIAAAPYLVITLYKVPALYFGWIFGANAAGFMIAAQVNRRLLKSYRSDDILPVGALGAVLATVVLLVDALTGFGGADRGVFACCFLLSRRLGLCRPTRWLAGWRWIRKVAQGLSLALFGVSQFSGCRGH